MSSSEHLQNLTTKSHPRVKLMVKKSKVVKVEENKGNIHFLKFICTVKWTLKVQIQLCLDNFVFTLNLQPLIRHYIKQ